MSESWNMRARERAEAQTSAGITFLAKRQLDKAINQFHLASASDPTDPDPFGALALALAIKGQNKEALDALQQSYKLRHSTETLISTGIIYYLSHDYDAALNTFKKVLETDPKASAVLGPMAFAFVRKGDLRQAEQFFNRLVRANPRSELGYYGIGLVKYMQGDFKAAQASTERAEGIFSYPPAVLILAKLSYLQGDSINGARLAQKYNHSTQRAWQQRSMTEIGYPAKHDVHWDPFFADTFDNGYLLMARTLPPTQQNRRASLARSGNAERAEKQLKEELIENANDFHLLRELALVQFANGDLAGATQSFHTIREQFPQCQVDLLHLARALALDGKADEARLLVKEFQRSSPNQKLAPALSDLAKTRSTPQPAMESSSNNDAIDNKNTPQFEPSQAVQQIEPPQSPPVAQPAAVKQPAQPTTPSEVPPIAPPQQPTKSDEQTSSTPVPSTEQTSPAQPHQQPKAPVIPASEF